MYIVALSVINKLSTTLYFSGMIFFRYLFWKFLRNLQFEFYYVFQDFEGQKRAERLFQVIILVFGVS
jgi:hypothetical protein